MTAIAGGTKIEWADFTFNPWWGCERVSPACAHCYADTFAKRVGQKDLWTKTGEHGFRWLSDANWAKPLKWAKTVPAVLGRRPRVFCASMADVFEERPEVDSERYRLFDLILRTPELDWLLLTKRPEFARDWLEQFWHDHGELGWAARAGVGFNVPPNMWMGVSIENSRFTWRADVLRQIPAAVRFISAEPLLGSLFPALVRSDDNVARREPHARLPLDLTGIDWVIVGGESGPKARPFHLEHAREIVDAALGQCGTCSRVQGAEGVARASERSESLLIGTPLCDRTTAVFVKQLGAKPVGWTDVAVGEYEEQPLKLRDSKGGDITEWPADLRIREHPRSAT